MRWLQAVCAGCLSWLPYGTLRASSLVINDPPVLEHVEGVRFLGDRKDCRALEDVRGRYRREVSRMHLGVEAELLREVLELARIDLLRHDARPQPLDED